MDPLFFVFVIYQKLQDRALMNIEILIIYDFFMNAGTAKKVSTRWGRDLLHCKG